MSTSPQNPALLDISTLAPLIEKREVSPVEVVRACLDRIERLNPRYRAYLSVYPELALEVAMLAESEIAAGAYRGPLHGIPLAVKDLFQVEGMERTCGSRIPEPPGPESTSVTRLKAAVAVFFGVVESARIRLRPHGHQPPFRNDPAELENGGWRTGVGTVFAAGLLYRAARHFPPCGFTGEGLLVGLQLIGPVFGDALVL